FAGRPGRPSAVTEASLPAEGGNVSLGRGVRGCQSGTPGQPPPSRGATPIPVFQLPQPPGPHPPASVDNLPKPAQRPTLWSEDRRHPRTESPTTARPCGQGSGPAPSHVHHETTTRHASAASPPGRANGPGGDTRAADARASRAVSSAETPQAVGSGAPGRPGSARWRTGTLNSPARPGTFVPPYPRPPLPARSPAPAPPATSPGAPPRTSTLAAPPGAYAPVSPRPPHPRTCAPRPPVARPHPPHRVPTPTPTTAPPPPIQSHR
ncbi:Wiskott-Aldrich syndrome protein, partial [Streptomyces sp. SolWspMP-sol7th]